MTEFHQNPRREREIAIAAQAQQIALALFSSGPVEPERIAEREGIAFRYTSFPEEFDGILLHEKGRFYIVCNERRARRGSPRSRFTFAHELGHYFLGDHREALASGEMPAHFSLAEFVSHKPIERESDLFAANLLMPHALLARAARRIGCDGLRLVTQLADEFGTSITATAFRALDAGFFPEPAAVLRWDLGGKLLGRRLSPESFERLDDPRLPSSAPEGSVSSAMIADVGLGMRVGRSNRWAWFGDLLYSDEPANYPLREEVLSLGRFGYLTLVCRESSTQGANG